MRTIKIGDEILYRGIIKTRIESISVILNLNNAYKEVKVSEVDDQIAERCYFDLDIGKWARFDQITFMDKENSHYV